MKDRCIEAVEKVLNRRITKSEAQGIEARIAKNMRFAALDDPAYASMGRTHQLLEAAKRSADDKQLAHEGNTMADVQRAADETRAGLSKPSSERASASSASASAPLTRE